MDAQKPLLIPWLIMKIDSHKYPGLEWVNSERTRFSIPWKHAMRKDLSDDDVKIFKDWAIESGCYDPNKQEKDPARWKRNLRSALHQKDNIRMVEDLSSDATNPRKVFEIYARETEIVALYTEESAAAEANPTSRPGFSSQAGGGVLTAQTLSDAMNHLQLYQESEVQMDHGAATCYNTSTTACYNTGAGACYDGGAAAAIEVPLQIQPEQVPAAQPQQINEQQILRHFAHNSFVTDFEVHIYYRGTRVKSTIVTNGCGFCLTSRQQPPPGSHVEDVVLPFPRGLVSDQLLIQAVNQILTNLEEGTLVEVRDGAICARRYGNCRSFWSVTNTPTTALPSPIEKKGHSVLYTLQQFITELMEFIGGRRRDSPQYAIWICLGETWPDGTIWQKKCVMVEIIPVVMRLLHEMSYSTGASSLQSSDINLQISSSSTTTDAALALLRSIEEIMDWTQ